MRILVRLEGFLAAQFWIEKEIQVPKGITWKETLLMLITMLKLGSNQGRLDNNLSSMRELAIFVLNGKESPFDTILGEGDIVSVFSPLSGG